MHTPQLDQGSLIQLNPDTVKNPSFAHCIMTVRSCHAWGVQCYVECPGQGSAYYRASWEEVIDLKATAIFYAND